MRAEAQSGSDCVSLQTSASPGKVCVCKYVQQKSCETIFIVPVYCSFAFDFCTWMQVHLSWDLGSFLLLILDSQVG